MILIKNTQRKTHVNTTQLKKDINKLLHSLGYPDFDIGIWLTTNQTMRKYNQLYRGKNKPTDILSFPFHSKIKPGQKIKVKSQEQKNLGDILFSPEYIKKDARCLGQTVDQRMRVLLVHGICHLIGYDHIKDKDFKLMQKKESELLKTLK